MYKKGHRHGSQVLVVISIIDFLTIKKTKEGHNERKTNMENNQDTVLHY